MYTYLSWYQAAVLQGNEPHPYLDTGWFPISRLVRSQNASFSTVGMDLWCNDGASSASRPGPTQETGSVIKDSFTRLLSVPRSSLWPVPVDLYVNLGFPFLGQGSEGSERPRKCPRKWTAFPHRVSKTPHTYLLYTDYTGFPYIHHLVRKAEFKL